MRDAPTIEEAMASLKRVGLADVGQAGCAAAAGSADGLDRFGALEATE